MRLRVKNEFGRIGSWSMSSFIFKNEGEVKNNFQIRLA